MVAASKLRRAQTAAEAARPYAEKMDAVISNIASAAAGSPGAPPLLTGTGKNQVHLLLVCTGERGLSRRLQFLDRAPGARARQYADGRRARKSNSSASAARATSSSAACSTSRSSSTSTCAQCASSASTMPRTSRKKVIARFEAGEFDVCTLFYSRFQSVIAQVPTAQQIIPLEVETPDSKAQSRPPTNTSRRKTRSSPICCRAISRCRFSARCWRTTPRSTARR